MPKLSMKERVELAMMPRPQRVDFIKRELRARRFFLIPAMVEHEEAMRDYEREVGWWRADRSANEFMGEESAAECPVMPGCPSYLPAEKDIREWLLRCLEDRTKYTKCLRKVPVRPVSP